MALKKYSKPKMNTTYSGYHSNLSTTSRGKAGIDYIVVHYTGTNASAKNNCIFFSRNGSSTNASADFFIGKTGKIWRYNSNLKKYYSWHCGDGYGAYGITNGNSIGIECVSDGSAAFTAKQIAALGKLVKWLQYRFNVDSDHVVRHYDASRKTCPAWYAGASGTAKGKRWKTLKAKIAQ